MRYVACVASLSRSLINEYTSSVQQTAGDKSLTACPRAASNSSDVALVRAPLRPAMFGPGFLEKNLWERGFSPFVHAPQDPPNHSKATCNLQFSIVDLDFGFA